MDWQLTCRVCLESGDMVSLFDWDENKEQLGDKYTYCCGIPVATLDSLPTLICLNCVDKLTLAYQFKQQCLSANDTLKECLEEFKKTSSAVASTSKAKVTETETITIKQENGMLLQYELPVEHDPNGQWTRAEAIKAPGIAVVTKAPGPRKRGRPRKYPNEQGQIETSPYHRKKEKPLKAEQVSLTTLLANDGLAIKDEPDDDDDEDDDQPRLFEELVEDDDPDFEPEELEEEAPAPRKRGRPRKIPKEKQTEDNGEDMLLKETIMAFSEPIPEHILNPKPKKRQIYKKKYTYEKTHTCETCGSSFTSNASLQAHIRRHLGIKPFVCSLCGYACVLNMELRRHMLRHTGQRPYKCRICDRRFGDFGSRQKHERRVLSSIHRDGIVRFAGVTHNTKDCSHPKTVDCPYVWSLLPPLPQGHVCSACGFATNSRLGLQRHMLRHTGVKPHKCRYCDRRFFEHGDRQKHERLHMGVRPYQCSLCGKAFTYSYVLANHMLTHTGEKKYACAPCNKKFTKAHHLKYHNKVHHKDVYVQQQLEAEAKKVRQQMNVSGLSGVVSGTIVDGQLQLIQGDGGSEDGDQDAMQVVEDGDLEEEETDRAVAEMQAVELDAEFMEDDDKSNLD